MTFAGSPRPSRGDPLHIIAVLGGDDAIQWASWHSTEPDLERFLIGWVDCGAGPASLVPAGDYSACRAVVRGMLTPVGMAGASGGTVHSTILHSSHIVQYPHGH